MMMMIRNRYHLRSNILKNINHNRSNHYSNPYQHQIRSLFNPSSSTPPRLPRTSQFIRLTTLIISITGLSIYLSDTRSSIHSKIILPIIQSITSDDPERAHRLAIKLLRLIGSHHLVTDRIKDGDELSIELWGHQFDNPIGIAAGFDKDGDAIDGLYDIGFGYVEVGSVTPEPQPGNPKPRLFRIPSTESIINRYGFNSQGHLSVLSKLRTRVIEQLDQYRYLFAPTISTHDPSNLSTLRSLSPNRDDLSPTTIDQNLSHLLDQLDLPRSLRKGKVLGINLGKNKTSSPDSIQDFVNGIERFGPLTDTLIINVSSPNTPGLRSLQSRSILRELLFELIKTRDSISEDLKKRPALLVKISPDLSYQELVDISQVALETKIDGIIISNTTISRPTQAGSDSKLNETGGLSGPALKPISLRAISTIYDLTSGKIPLIGCGGIRTGQDAIDYAKSGASLIQVYSSLIYGGIGLPRKIKDEVQTILEREGKDWRSLVGSEVDSVGIQWGIDDVFEGIREVERRIERFGQRTESDRGVEIDQRTEVDQPAEIHQRAEIDQRANVQELDRKVEDRGRSEIIKSSEPDLSPVKLEEKEVGIFSDWRNRRRNEIERGDHHRVV